METVALPDIAVPVSRLGLGGCPLGGHGWGDVDDRNSIAAVNTALERGINFFDTADIYGLGHSEEILSQALGAKRHNVVIASKFGVRRTESGKTVLDNSPEWLQQALAASLKRLRLDCIPLYYLHWPDGVTPLESAIEALADCQRRGQIGAIGLSNVSPEQLHQACQIARISVAQVQYSLVDRQLAEDLQETARRHGVPLVPWGSLAQGLLTGKYNAQSQFDASDRRSRYENFTGEKFLSNLKVVDQLRGIAPRYGRSIGQTAIRWLLDAPGVGSVLFGAKTPEQVIDNLGAMDWKLDASDHDQLSASTNLSSKAA